MKPLRKKQIGIALCLAAIVTIGAEWAWARSERFASTDNAYVRGDITSLAPKVGGYVTLVNVEDNQSVEIGDILFQIDDIDYRARLAQADANVSAAEAHLKNINAETQLQRSVINQSRAQQLSTIADLTLAIKTSDRRRSLVQNNVVSQAQVDESDAVRSKAEASVTAAKATVEAQEIRIAVLASQRDAAVAAIAQANAARKLAQIDLDNTVVQAPVSGVVGNRQVRLGRLASPGASLLDIVPVNDLWVVANFKETQIERMHPGQQVRIFVDGYPKESFEGAIDSFAPGSGSAFSLLPADNATGNFVRVVQRIPVKIRFDSKPSPKRLVPGMSARVEIDVRDAK